MAEAMEAALADKKHLLVEAGTGTGKTLAYLVPAILSGKRVIVISTGTKNLQEQLFYKDIPFLQKHFDGPCEVCYMKGRNNFACRQKIYDADKQPGLRAWKTIADFQIIRDWEQNHYHRRPRRDQDTAGIQLRSGKSWMRAAICAAARSASSSSAASLRGCTSRAHESDIIIVNHHLFFADLAVKDDDYGGIIPEYAAVVFDEAHEIEDVAGQVLWRLGFSNYQFEELVRDVGARPARQAIRIRRTGPNPRSLWTIALEQFSCSSANPKDASASRSHEAFFTQEWTNVSTMFSDALELIALQLELVKNAVEETFPLIRRARSLQAVEFWMQRAISAPIVYWIERRGRGCFLQATPIDVSSILEEKLFRRARHRDPHLRHARRRWRHSSSPKQRLGIRTPEPWWSPAISNTRSKRCSTSRRLA
jgi:ATP-dependent DNA helicase DinG